MKRVDAIIEEKYESCWWKVDGDWIYVYTEDLTKAKKMDLKPMATYMTKDKLKVFAYQYRVEKHSKEYKKLFIQLAITDENEYKIKEQRRKKVKKT